MLHSEADFKEAISYHLSYLGNRYIEVFETNESEYARAKASQMPEKRQNVKNPNYIEDNLLQEGRGILRLRGLPYSSTENDVRDFFRNLKIVKDGVKRPIIGGKPSGEAYVVFENKDEAHKGLALNMEKIGTRFIEIFVANARELDNFMYHAYNSEQNQYSHNRMPNIPLDKRRNTLMMMGLPFSV